MLSVIIASVVLKTFQTLQVRLLSDFSYSDIPFTLPTESSKAALGADEYNLLYVALTRFLHCLVLKSILPCAGPRRT